MRDLWRVQNRRAQQRPEHAAIGDREGPALEIGQRECAVLRFPGEAPDLSFDPGEVETIGVPQYRNDQPFAGAYGDADVVIVLEHHLIALYLGVDPREGTQSADGRLHEKGRDAQPDAMPILERLLVALPQRHHRRHVHFVERGQHRGGALHFDEAASDGGTSLRHADPLLGAIACGCARFLRYRRSRLRRGRFDSGRGHRGGL